jgi:hypothetical protein
MHLNLNKKNKKKLKSVKNLFYNIFLYFFILICIITYLRKLGVFILIRYLILNSDNTENFIKSLKFTFYCLKIDLIVQTFYFFTSQSNFLVMIVLFLNFTKFKKNKYYPLLAFITLIDILLTGIVWNLIASPTNELLEIKKNFFTISLFQHLYIPLFYVIFFFTPFYINSNSFFTLSRAYYGLIHPLFYLFYSLILGYFSEEKLYCYPYNFTNPNQKCNLSSIFLDFFQLNNYQEKQGFLGVLINNLFLLIVLIIFIPFLYYLHKIRVKNNNIIK